MTSRLKYALKILPLAHGPQSVKHGLWRWAYYTWPFLDVFFHNVSNDTGVWMVEAMHTHHDMTFCINWTREQLSNPNHMYGRPQPAHSWPAR